WSNPANAGPTSPRPAASSAATASSCPPGCRRPSGGCPSCARSRSSATRKTRTPWTAPRRPCVRASSAPAACCAKAWPSAPMPRWPMPSVSMASAATGSSNGYWRGWRPRLRPDSPGAKWSGALACAGQGTGLHSVVAAFHLDDGETALADVGLDLGVGQFGMAEPAFPGRQAHRRDALVIQVATAVRQHGVHLPVRRLVGHQDVEMHPATVGAQYVGVENRDLHAHWFTFPGSER